MAIVKAWGEKIRGLDSLPPVEVKEGKVRENIVSGKDVDVFKFVSPKSFMSTGAYLWHNPFGFKKSLQKEACNEFGR